MLAELLRGSYNGVLGHIRYPFLVVIRAEDFLIAFGQDIHTGSGSRRGGYPREEDM